MKSTEINTTGKLEYAPGDIYNCVDCGTTYPIKFDRNTSKDAAFCNGHSIILCPWCRPDSMPWKHGRGQ